MVNFKPFVVNLSKKHKKNTRLAEALPDFGSITSCMKVIVALLGVYALDVSKSRFQKGNSFKLTNNVVGKILENYED